MSYSVYKVEVKIDKTTLPKDGQRIRFAIYNVEGLEGIYIEEEDMFWINEKTWHYTHDIHSWEPIEEEQPPVNKN